MSHDAGPDLGDFFALPTFKADEALMGLRRQLRELKLTEKSGASPVRFEWRGLPVVALALSAGEGAPSIEVDWVEQPSQRPQWRKTSLKSSADVRRWLDEAKRRMARWGDDD